MDIVLPRSHVSRAAVQVGGNGVSTASTQGHRGGDAPITVISYPLQDTLTLSRSTMDDSEVPVHEDLERDSESEPASEGLRVASMSRRGAKAFVQAASGVGGGASASGGGAAGALSPSVIRFV